MPDWKVISLGVLLAVAFVFVAYRRRWSWTGFVATPTDEAPKATPGKTLWDWLDLLLIPIILVTAGGLLNEAQSQRDIDRADARAKVDRAIALDQQQERLLQDYLDSMTTLVLDKNLRAQPKIDNAQDLKAIGPTPVQVAAATRTLAALRSLDGTRKAVVLRYLAESLLISPAYLNRPILRLSRADLRGAKLAEAYLCGIVLDRPDLTGADLTGADLTYADLSNGAVLTDASFHDADLFQANLNEADVTRADFAKASLEEASLDRVVGERTSFAGSDLLGATGNLESLVDADFTDALVEPDPQLTGNPFADAQATEYEHLKHFRCFLGE